MARRLKLDAAALIRKGAEYVRQVYTAVAVGALAVGLADTHWLPTIGQRLFELLRVSVVALIAVVLLVAPKLVPPLYCQIRGAWTKVLGAVMGLGAIALLLLPPDRVNIAATRMLDPLLRDSDLVKQDWYRVFPGILAFIACLLIHDWRGTRNPSQAPTWDDPKIAPDTDQLNRNHLAKKIADTVISPMIPRPSRIGIYGPWGSGKTTLLNFVSHHLNRETSVVVARFSPWSCTSREDAWIKFIDSIESALIAKLGPSVSARLQWRRFFRGMITLGRDWSPKTELGSHLVSVLLKRVQSSVDDHKRHLTALLDKYCRDLRLVILIDDLDRADPKIALEVLSSVKDLLDLPSATYIIAIDAAIIAKAIEEANPGFQGRDAYLYLEKIVHWSINLDMETQCFQLLEDPQLGAVTQKLNVPALQKIEPHLPRNPRRFKRFICMLAAQPPAPNVQPNDSTFNWPVYYLARLLHAEYPAALERIREKKELRDALSASGQVKALLVQLHGRMFGDETETKGLNDEVLNEWKRLLVNDLPGCSDDRDKERVWELFMAMHNNARLNSDLELLAASEKADVVVSDAGFWELFSRWDQSRKTDGAGYLEEALRHLHGDPEKVWRAVFHKALEHRRALAARMIDEVAEEDVLRELERVQEVGDFLGDLISVALTKNDFSGALGPLEVKSLYRMCCEYAHFHKPDYYERLRFQEVALLDRVLEFAKDNPEPYLRLFERRLPPSETQEDCVQHDLWMRATKVLCSARARELLGSFREPKGVLKCLSGENGDWDQMLLLWRNDWFHDKTTRDCFYDVLKESETNPAVRGNLYYYFAFLMEKGDAELRADREFMTRIWTYLVSGPLNLRMIGTLLRYKRVLENDWNAPNALPVPDQPCWKPEKSS